MNKISKLIEDIGGIRDSLEDIEHLLRTKTVHGKETERELLFDITHHLEQIRRKSLTTIKRIKPTIGSK